MRERSIGNPHFGHGRLYKRRGGCVGSKLYGCTIEFALPVCRREGDWSLSHRRLWQSLGRGSTKRRATLLRGSALKKWKRQQVAVKKAGLPHGAVRRAI